MFSFWLNRIAHSENCLTLNNCRTIRHDQAFYILPHKLRSATMNGVYMSMKLSKSVSRAEVNQNGTKLSFSRKPLTESWVKEEFLHHFLTSNLYLLFTFFALEEFHYKPCVYSTYSSFGIILGLYWPLFHSLFDF